MKRFFFGSGAEKVHQKVHQFTPGGIWLEMNKINELLHQFITHTHTINKLIFVYNGVFLLWIMVLLLQNHNEK